MFEIILLMVTEKVQDLNLIGTYSIIVSYVTVTPIFNYQENVSYLMYVLTSPL